MSANAEVYPLQLPTAYFSFQLFAVVGTGFLAVLFGVKWTQIVDNGMTLGAGAQPGALCNKVALYALDILRV